MKKIFTLISVALAAMSMNAQTTPEVIDINSEDIKGKIETSIANPELLNNPLFILVKKFSILIYVYKINLIEKNLFKYIK
jgi:hypothetical protein